MVYRFILKILTHKNNSSIHYYAQILTFLFCQITRLNPFKRSQPISLVNVMGLTFSNPVSLAAGFDRTGTFLPYSESIGFGSIELGTFNIDATNAIDNSVVNLLQNFKKAYKNKYKTKHPQQWGISLGSLKNTLDEKTVADYTSGMNLFWDYADYFVINLSRPESDARALKPDMYKLEQFITNIKQQHQILNQKRGKNIAIVAKLAIDYQHNKSTTEILQLLQKYNFDGIILAFENWPYIQQTIGYLRNIKTQFVDFPFIVVGGIRSAQDSQQFLAAGASLIQVYSTLVQQGPFQTRKLISKLVDKE